MTRRLRRPWQVLLMSATSLLALATVATGAPTHPVPIPSGRATAAATVTDVLLVAPGKVGSLKMGTTTRKAKKRGWIARDSACGGWTAGRRAYRLDAAGEELYKAYPDTIKRGRVQSFDALGAGVRTARGIRARSVGADQTPGSPLADVRAAYPDLVLLGAEQPDLDPSQPPWAVYSTGTRARGWLDFFVTSDQEVDFMVIRSDKVKWGEPRWGC